MISKHYTKKDLESKSVTEVAGELKKLGFPISYNLLDIALTWNDINIFGQMEAHPTINGGITYLTHPTQKEDDE